MKILKLLFCSLLAIIFFTPLIYSIGNSISYYADVEIDINQDGSVTVDGTTNYDFLKNITNSHEFTSKKGKVWTLISVQKM